ncbi:hypothetical protein EJB05_45024 [Eragrostis curvula]|uniref:Uncharacterized protein n=1 Tax=Eragrostis curvula TaxID=38414 RepID=A0A5J9TKI6_9POAL|nr:hypothetical protein EJB05_45024 [Eragrostis curvula]
MASASWMPYHRGGFMFAPWAACPPKRGSLSHFCLLIEAIKIISFILSTPSVRKGKDLEGKSAKLEVASAAPAAASLQGRACRRSLQE